MKKYISLALILWSSISLAQDLNPYLQSPTSSSIWVSWKTANGSETLVEYGTDASNLDLSAVGNIASLASNYQWHKVQLTNLEPNTPYYYRVISGGESSTIERFRTQPLEGSNTGHYRFIIIGDHQRSNDPIGNQRYKKAVDAARAKAEAQFGSPVEDHVSLVVNLGDQVDVGTLDQYENLHLNQSQGLCRNIPFVTVVGNHEYYSDGDLNKYFTHFEYDDTNFHYKNLTGDNGEHYYAFQVANILFVMMNSNESWQTQVDWVRSVILEADADPNIDWIFSDCHHPLYAEQLVGDASSYMLNQVLPEMLQSEKYSMYLSGHAHLYARGSLAEEPVYHIINGGASWDQYWGQEAPESEFDYEETQKTIERELFQIVDINLDTREMFVGTYSIGSVLSGGWDEDVRIDTFYLKRDGLGPDQPNLSSITPEVTLPYSFSGSIYSGNEPNNSTEFQFADESGSFEEPAYIIKRDYENIYLSTGAPDYTPIDQNAGVNIFETTIEAQDLPQGTNYARLRYRDQSMHWSPWSVAQEFEVTNGWIGDPIAYFPFNNSLNDESTEGKDFSVDSSQGIQFENDPDLGQASVYDGSSFVTIQDGNGSSDGLPERVFTVAAWVKFDQLNEKDGFLGIIQDNSDEEAGWNLGLRNNRFTFSLASASTNALTHLTDQTTIETEEWYHVAATYDGSTMRLFVNGLLKESLSTQNGSIAYPSEGWLVIGAYKDADEQVIHDGLLDEVTLWQRLLSPSDIYRVANEPEPLAIAYFPFNENINDESNNGKDFSNGNNLGVTFDNDPERGTVASFDGNSWINIQSGNIPNDGLPNQDITVATWVKVDDALTWGGFIGCIQDNGATEFGWLLGTRNQQFSIALNTISTSNLTYLTDPDAFTIGEWYYVTVTYDGEVMRLYVNGVEKATSDNQTGPIRYPDSGWFQIGSYKDDNEDFRHNGKMDEVLIWGRALTEIEINDLYNNGGIYTDIKTPLQRNQVPLHLTISPNPNDGIFSVALDNVLNSPTTICLYDNNGKLLRQKLLDKGVKEIKFQVDNLPSGSYVLEAKNEVQQNVMRVIIKGDRP